jgi:polyphosphate:AMP phosphotransferase
VSQQGADPVFETAELGRKATKREYKRRIPSLRQALLSAQESLRHTDLPVIVLFGGVDGAGKGDVVHALNEWMDPRWMVTRTFERPSQEEAERPPYWRFWQALPPKGQIGLLLSAWYSKPLLRRAYGGPEGEFEESLEEIADFEKQLADDGAIVVKFWLHLGKDGQEKRFKRLAKDPLQAWRVSKRDWEHWRKYDDFVGAAERIIGRTSTGECPWHIVEGVCPRYASLHVGELLLETIQRRLAERETSQPSTAPPAHAVPSEASTDIELPNGRTPTVLDKLDMTQRLDKRAYRTLLAAQQGRLNCLQLRAREQKVSSILVFEGWDASGKGGAIRRINAALDSRGVRVVPIGVPTDEERAQHYLWRFWRHVSRAGRVTIFDRSWYGRVLVERVEGFASEKEWRRAFAEINRFEKQLTDHQIVLVKFWMHLTQEAQLERFREREQTPWKRWKLTDEDWRNRGRWDDYELAVHDMVERTSTRAAPWILVEANDKPFARIKVLKTLCDALEARVGSPEQSSASPKKKRANDKKRGSR